MYDGLNQKLCVCFTFLPLFNQYRVDGFQWTIHYLYRVSTLSLSTLNSDVVVYKINCRAIQFFIPFICIWLWSHIKYLIAFHFSLLFTFFSASFKPTGYINLCKFIQQKKRVWLFYSFFITSASFNYSAWLLPNPEYI